MAKGGQECLSAPLNTPTLQILQAALVNALSPRSALLERLPYHTRGTVTHSPRAFLISPNRGGDTEHTIKKLSRWKQPHVGQSR